MYLPQPVLASPPGPPPSVRRSSVLFDYDEPLPAFAERCHAAWEEYRNEAVYVGPRCLVVCDLPTVAFWRAVYAQYGAWAYEARHNIGRRALDSPRQWYDPQNPGADRSHLKDHREACLTGRIYLRGRPVPYHAWPTRNEVGYRPRRPRKKNRRPAPLT